MIDATNHRIRKTIYGKLISPMYFPLDMKKMDWKSIVTIVLRERVLYENKPRQNTQQDL